VFVRGEALFEDRYLPQLGRVVIIKNVLFAVRDEAWRIPAFLLTQRVFYRTRTYTQQIERMQSELLGYTTEEIEQGGSTESRHHRRFFSRRHRPPSHRHHPLLAAREAASCE
jgi:hypothetical protein